MGIDNICLFCFSLRALKSNVFGIAAKADMFSARVLRVAACGMTRDG
jgi:LytS/YehU family sensor histidine kinase